MGPPLDADQDGYVSEACGGTDCDDQNELVNPAATEGPAVDGTYMDTWDNDCDGLTDGADADCVTSL
jgi:hypothetical protein